MKKDIRETEYLPLDKIHPSKELDEFLRDFLEKLQGINNSLPLITDTLIEYEEVNVKKYNSFFEKFGTKKNKKWVLKHPYISQVKPIIRQIENTHNAFHIAPESLFVTMVSLYDAYLSNILSAIFKSKRELSNVLSKAIAPQELTTFESIEEALGHIIDKELDTLFRSSHQDQIQWIEQKFNVSLSENLDILPIFVEICERRNLFVHCNGKVSEQYLRICKSKGVQFSKTPKIGDRVGISQQYFTIAYMCLYEMATRITHVLWRKIYPDQIDYSDHNLNEHICISLLENEEYILVIRLLDFILSLDQVSDDATRRTYIINKALAYYLQGQKETAIKILDNEDWSASGNEFLLAKSIIKENYKESIVIMKKLGRNGFLKAEHYSNWPLFKVFIKTKEFQKSYKSIFKKPFLSIEKNIKPIKVVT